MTVQAARKLKKTPQIRIGIKQHISYQHISNIRYQISVVEIYLIWYISTPTTIKIQHKTLLLYKCWWSCNNRKL